MTNVSHIKSLINYAASKVSDWHYYRARQGRSAPLPCVDLDMMLYQEDTSEPYVVIEYKHGNLKSVDLNDGKIRSIARLGDRASLPAFLTFYYLIGDKDLPGQSTNEFYIVPLNDLARAYTAEPRWVTERQYVRLIYKMKGLDMALVEALNLCSTLSDRPSPTVIKESQP